MGTSDTQFPTLHDLVKKPAAVQRRILRMHRENRFALADPEDNDFRDGLDRELRSIMERELEAQVHPHSTEAYTDIPAFAALLTCSPVFVQYLNYYHFFGVRFAAGRIANPCSNTATASESDCNEPIVGLPSPPLKDGVPFFNEDVAYFRNDILPHDQANKPIKTALDFLDDFLSYRDQLEKSHPEAAWLSTATPPTGDERTNYELWLRGLYAPRPDDPREGGSQEESRFRELTTGLLSWARSRYHFYIRLEARMGPEKEAWLKEWQRRSWDEGHWNVNNPIVARCALVDFYWLARILRADVSARGLVTYSSRSWLGLLAMREPPLQDAATKETAADSAPAEPDIADKEILRWEEVLRSVFGYACDLIQNAVEKAEVCEDRKNNVQPDSGAPSWRAVYDEELQEIRAQREQWRGDSGPSSKRQQPDATCQNTTEGWSRRIWTGEDVDNLVGIAFSGGGIRSATFNLGVLQCLQELDLLRHVDYLSTVSGGGYIGAWLLGNVRRTRYWLSRMTSWDSSIEHLRRYSNYLAPMNGILSVDTWTMWGTWIRNALLIQVTAFSWLASLIVLVLCIKPVFEWLGAGGVFLSQGLVFLLLVILGTILSFYLLQLSRTRASTLGRMKNFIARQKPKLKKLLPVADFADRQLARLSAHIDSAKAWAVLHGDLFPLIAAGIAWVASFLTAALLWGQAVNFLHGEGLSYFLMLKTAGRQWPPALGAAFVLCLWGIAFSSIEVRHLQRRSDRLLTSFLMAVGGAATAYLSLCGLLRLYGQFLTLPDAADSAPWFAFAFGQPVAMSGATLAVIIFIGLLGRNSPDWCREWWTRYGALIGMIGTGTLGLTLAAICAPLWFDLFLGLNWKAVKIGALLSWVGSVIGGLLAGKSSRTGKNDEKLYPVLQWIAWIGGLLFIIGAVMLASTAVHLVLRNVLVNDQDANPYWHALNHFGHSGVWIIVAALVCMAFLFSARFDLNTFGLNQFYRNRLVRCYLGATRWQPGKRHPHLFTGFDSLDDLPLQKLSVFASGFCDESFRGPFPIINCTLNLGGSSDLTVHTRQSSSFAMTPLYSGTTRPKVGFAPTKAFYGGNLTVGQAIAISGAAASPNMGYNTSPLVSLLMTMFNVRLGWWFPNPRNFKPEKISPPGALPNPRRSKPKKPGSLSASKSGKSSSLSALYLGWELFGLADEGGDFINLSDGGHFENLGIYELIRRRTRVIIAADAECDPAMTFGSLGNVVRICETDFGAKIEIDVSSIRKKETDGLSHSHCAVGKITYSNGALGYLIYIKSSTTGDEDVGVAQYRSAHPTFPQESTSDQFFSEDQFEAYRRLGMHITERAFRGAKNEVVDPFVIAAKLFDLWVPAGFSKEAFISHAKTFDEWWERFRTDPKLDRLLYELTGHTLASPPPPAGPLDMQELCACMELLQLMENVFFDLRLDDFWDHPDNRGWAMFFTMCAKSAKFREAWSKIHQIYGIRFEYFCHRHLGLVQDRPVDRV